jgi:hypothetical protein
MMELWLPPDTSVLDFLRGLLQQAVLPPPAFPPPPQQQRRSCPCFDIATSPVRYDDHKLAVLRGALKECCLSDEKATACFAAHFIFNHERPPNEHEIISRRSLVSRIARLNWADNLHYKQEHTECLDERAFLFFSSLS